MGWVEDFTGVDTLPFCTMVAEAPEDACFVVSAWPLVGRLLDRLVLGGVEEERVYAQKPVR